MFEYGYSYSYTLFFCCVQYSNTTFLKTKIMRAIIEKKTCFVEVNEKFAELVSTTYILGIPIYRDSKNITAPYGTEYSLDEKEIKSYYVSQILLGAIRYRH